MNQMIVLQYPNWYWYDNGQHAYWRNATPNPFVWTYIRGIRGSLPNIAGPKEYILKHFNADFDSLRTMNGFEIYQIAPKGKSYRYLLVAQHHGKVGYILIGDEQDLTVFVDTPQLASDDQ